MAPLRHAVAAVNKESIPDNLAFVILEGCIYGFGLWWFGYLYVWSVLAIVTLLMRAGQTSVLVSCIVLGAFGSLFSIPYFVAGGWSAGFSYIISGIPYDLMHFAGNVVVGLVLYRPLPCFCGRGRRIIFVSLRD